MKSDIPTPAWAEGFDRDAHMQRVRQREAEVLSEDGLAQIQERAHTALAAAERDRRRLIHQALTAPTRSKAIVWLRNAADRLGVAVAKEVACRRGCSWCCHTSVIVAQSEARLIGRAIGSAPVESPSGAVAVGDDVMRPPSLPDRYKGTPCTFLRGGECSIFAHRPLACRLNASFDRDALLCQVVPGETISVPFVDASLEKAVYHQRVALGELAADVRDWFPAGAPREER